MIYDNILIFMNNLKYIKKKIIIKENKKIIKEKKINKIIIKNDELYSWDSESKFFLEKKKIIQELLIFHHMNNFF